jgi:hypothetical protein
MGSQHSTALPTEADFLVKHKPLPVNLVENAYPAGECTFRLPKKAWRHNDINKKQPTNVSVESIGIYLKAESKDRRLVTDKQGNLCAVLQVKSHKEIQICSLLPAVKGARAIGVCQGKNLYEYGIVSRSVQNPKSIIVKLFFEGATTTFQLEHCGSHHQRTECLVVKRNGVVCASLTKHKDPKGEKTWDCRIGPNGIEPTLLVALVACKDKFPQLDEDFLRDNSGMQSYRHTNLLGASF